MIGPGVGMWGPNPTGSYCMAEIKNSFHVAEEMRISPAMVKKPYFQAVTKAEASRFWAIRPN